MEWAEWSNPNGAALWFLGQSGFYIKSDECSVVIDPYLSDSVGENNPLFQRSYPVPVEPTQIKADFYLVTHDHLDHLDPVTVKSYPFQKDTLFVAPRQAARKLLSLGIPKEQVHILDSGDSLKCEKVCITGIFALGTGPDVIDTTGYRIEFSNGKSVYHTSDTTYCSLLLKVAPKTDVLLPCINGKFGNLNVEQAVELAQVCNPDFIIPHHYDVMVRNGENPETFRYFCEESGMGERCRILAILEKFEW